MSKELNDQIIKEENTVELEEEEVTLPPDNVFSYTEQRSCFDITRMINKGDLKRDPFFQREDIWQNAQKTKFIDSLLKKLPIPSLCISVDAAEKYQVIDGRQRIKAIMDFLSEDTEWKLSDISSIDSRLSGKTNFEIRRENPQIFTIIENATLPINMIRCDYNRQDNLSYIFNIFHRLNSGGTCLNNQEIRNCIYSGSFAKLLKKCNKYPAWIKWIPNIALNTRMKGPERILLFFAMYENYESYDGKLAHFLNNYMHINKEHTDEWILDKEALFNKVIDIASKIKLKPIRNVYIDALLFGLAKNYENCKHKNITQLNNLYIKMIESQPFSPEKIKEGTSRKANMLARLNKALEIFGE